MKIIAFDIGDVWTGTAISDALQILARPYQTVQTTQLFSFIHTILTKEPIQSAVVGHPQTVRGTRSKQTEKVEQMFHTLQEQFPQIKWILWDERFSSKQAQSMKHARTKAEKVDAHSIAAALILDSYLSYLQIQKSI